MSTQQENPWSRILNEALNELNEALRQEQEKIILSARKGRNVEVDDLEAIVGSIQGIEGIISDLSPGGEHAPSRHVTPIKRRRRRRGGDDHTSSVEMRDPLLEALYELGGEAKSTEVFELMEKKVSFKPGDHIPTSGYRRIPRWRNAAAWVRYDLTKENYIRLNPSKKGTWILTPKGIRYVEKLQGK